MKKTNVGLLSYSIEGFMAATGYSRNKTYEAIARGDLRSFKDGKRRFISVDATREFIAMMEKKTAKEENLSVRCTGC